MSSPRVLLLSRYGPLGASSRVRFYQYLPSLKAAGLDVTVAPLFDDRYLERRYAGRRDRGAIVRGFADRLRWLLRSCQFDLVWIEYELLPWAPAWAERLLGMLGVPWIVEYDDAVFHRYDRHPNRAVRLGLGRKIDAVMRRAHAVVAGNDYLAARARQAGARRVEIIPSAIDTGRYLPASRPHDPPVIGWIGSPVTAPYLRIVEPVLARLTAARRARVVLIGTAAASWSFEAFERPWSESLEVDAINDLDIGIMPLVDDEWARGKCGYKLLQYMACARPVVASPVGVNRQIVEPGENGFLASTEADWERALGQLLDDEGLRHRLGRCGRAHVEERYALSVTAPRVLSVIRDVLAGSSSGRAVRPAGL